MHQAFQSFTDLGALLSQLVQYGNNELLHVFLLLQALIFELCVED